MFMVLWYLPRCKGRTDIQTPKDQTSLTYCLVDNDGPRREIMTIFGEWEAHVAIGLGARIPFKLRSTDIQSSLHLQPHHSRLLFKKYAHFFFPLQGLLSQATFLGDALS